MTSAECVAKLRSQPTARVADVLPLFPGLSRTSVYEAIRSGKFPVPALRVGSRIFLPTRPLLEALGLFEEGTNAP